MKRASTALFLLSTAALASAQVTKGKGQPYAPKSVITAVESVMAYEPGTVAIYGRELDLVLEARIDGVLVPLQHNSGSRITLAPAPRDPGFALLELARTRDTLTAPMEFLPSVRAVRTTKAVHVTLHGGEPGPYWLFYSMGLRPTPGSTPGIYYQPMLDLTSRYSGVLAKGVSDGGPLTVSFVVPPSFSGPLHFQGLCLYEKTWERTLSYSNATSIP